jgi:hypothetical protein
MNIQRSTAQYKAWLLKSVEEAAGVMIAIYAIGIVRIAIGIVWLLKWYVRHSGVRAVAV